VTSLKLHHIGFVSRDLAAAVELLAAAGLEISTPADSDPVQKASARFLGVETDGRVYVEVLQPTDETSPISGFLNKRGGGLHHLCFEVEDLEAACLELRQKGMKMVVDPVDCAALNRTFGYRGDRPARIAFFMVGERLLVELLQKSD
jgi:methylmalonyl-CoA/ethylmalonyl-CoA epimerase